jgi:hypothetical protein
MGGHCSPMPGFLAFKEKQLSIVTFSGTSLSRMAWLKKRMAAVLSRLANNRKSTVLPSLSTAQ